MWQFMSAAHSPWRGLSQMTQSLFTQNAISDTLDDDTRRFPLTCKFSLPCMRMNKHGSMNLQTCEAVGSYCG